MITVKIIFYFKFEKATLDTNNIILYGIINKFFKYMKIYKKKLNIKIRKDIDNVFEQDSTGL